MNAESKNFNSSYLYTAANYGQSLYAYIVKAERIDKDSPAFENIRYLVKRNQTSSCLSNFLDKKMLVLTLPNVPMSRAFKVFCAKDIKSESKETKVFIDVSDIVTLVNGEYVIKGYDIEKFISYLACALNTLIYYIAPTKILNNTEMVNQSTEAFAKLASNIIDYMRIGGIDNVRAKMMYLCALYYQIGILMKDDTDTVNQKALKISGLSVREAQLLRVQVTADDMKNISSFISAVSRVIREPSLKLENYIDKWLFLYGSGTQFATELYPAFANMLIHTYVGAYLVNQKQIEKLVGKQMIAFTTALFRIGGEIL